MVGGYARKPKEMSNPRLWDSPRASAAPLDRKACLEGWKFSARKSTVPSNHRPGRPFPPASTSFFELRNTNTLKFSIANGTESEGM